MISNVGERVLFQLHPTSRRKPLQLAEQLKQCCDLGRAPLGTHPIIERDLVREDEYPELRKGNGADTRVLEDEVKYLGVAGNHARRRVRDGVYRRLSICSPVPEVGAVVNPAGQRAEPSVDERCLVDRQAGETDLG